ncbi:hypothetical protein ACFW1P_27535 [Paenibacillus sp. NPDC058910]
MRCLLYKGLIGFLYAVTSTPLSSQLPASIRQAAPHPSGRSMRLRRG